MNQGYTKNKPGVFQTLQKTSAYQLLAKKTINELHLLLKLSLQNRKQFDTVFIDGQIPQQLNFFANSTDKILSLLSKPDNFSVLPEQGKIIFKIKVSTSQGQKLHQIQLQMRESINLPYKMIDAIGDLRNKINQIKVIKTNSCKTKQVNIEDPQRDRHRDGYKCIKCEAQQKILQQKDVIFKQVTKSLLSLREQLSKEINVHLSDKLQKIKAQVLEQMAGYIEQVKQIMKKEQFWDTQSTNQKKGQLLFNMLRTKSSKINQQGNCVTHPQTASAYHPHSGNDHLQQQTIQTKYQFVNKNINICIPNQFSQQIERIKNISQKLNESYQNKIGNSWLGFDQNMSSYVDTVSDNSYNLQENSRQSNSSEQQLFSEQEQNSMRIVRGKKFTNKYLNKKKIQEMNKYKPPNPLHDYDELHDQWNIIGMQKYKKSKETKENKKRID